LLDLHIAKQNINAMPNDINSYRLTSLEEPPEEYLAQIMREAAEDAEKENQAATQKYFEELQQNILKSKEQWKTTNPS
jgi:hypothetical protein